MDAGLDLGGCIPPPLTPPHKGEGDFLPALHGANLADFSSKSIAGISLPLVGRDQGWGKLPRRPSAAAMCDNPPHIGR
jgi:hypothetical protein